MCAKSRIRWSYLPQWLIKSNIFCTRKSLHPHFYHRDSHQTRGTGWVESQKEEVCVWDVYGPCDRHDMRNIFRILKAEFQSFCVNKNNLWHHFIACRHWYMCGLLKNVCLTVCVRAEVSRLSLSRWFPNFLSFIQSSLWSVEFSSEIVTVHRQHHFD